MKYNFFFLPILIFILYSCGSMTSVGSRFNKLDKVSTEKSGTKSDTLVLKEDFDITPYKTKININDSIPRFFDRTESGLNAWYNYDSLHADTTGAKFTKQKAGYRVLVITTDNLDEANKVKSEVFFRTDRKPVYISFDPPFYKVKAGDFISSSEANEFSFKLNQMGYADSKVVRDTVNILR